MQGKDQVMLCSMNNFDAYVVTRVTKAPKGYVFAVKSTDNITYFESTDDYLHMFSVSEKEGENWLEKILLARVRTTSAYSNYITTSLMTFVSLILFIKNAILSLVLTQQVSEHHYLELGLVSVQQHNIW